MDGIQSANTPPKTITYGKWEFWDITDQLKASDEPIIDRDKMVVVDTSMEASKEYWSPYFSKAAMLRNPEISSAASQIYAEAEQAVSAFYDGSISGEQLAQTYKSLANRMTDACREAGYPMPLWALQMEVSLTERFYSEFRYLILDEAVQRNRQEGEQYLVGEPAANRNWKYYNSDYYFQSEDAIAAVTDGFQALAKERNLEEYVSVQDYKEKGLNLYYNFNSAFSNHFALSEQFLINPDQVPPEGFQWFYQTGGNDGSTGKITSLTVCAPDGTVLEYHDYTTEGFDPTDPSKAITWATCRDEDGNIHKVSTDFRYNHTEEDLHNVADLLQFAAKSSKNLQMANRFLKNLQVYPTEYFSLFAKRTSFHSYA